MKYLNTLKNNLTSIMKPSYYIAPPAFDTRVSATRCNAAS